ncbi:SDR family NAD(P)-dependent oxidoreductase, partial [bacterium]|nr:SDR family NAD(P)-dependent oxidoreductase [bacterium]
LGAGRSTERCQQALLELQSRHPQASIHYFTADLASLQQVHHLAEEVHAHLALHSQGKLDVLVNNAGLVTSRYTITEDGYEKVFAVNHLAPFLLTHALMPALKSAPTGRVLTVSSKSHRNMRIFWANVMLQRIFNPLLAYKQSKLANVLFSAEFNRRFAGSTRMRAFAIDPGLVNTEIGMKNNHWLVAWVWNQRRQKGAHRIFQPKRLLL